MQTTVDVVGLHAALNAAREGRRRRSRPAPPAGGAVRGGPGPAVIRVLLPLPLRTLARVEGEVELGGELGEVRPAGQLHARLRRVDLAVVGLFVALWGIVRSHFNVARTFDVPLK